MVGHGHGIAHPLELVETVLEVADVAWNAIDHRRHANDERRCEAFMNDENASLQIENQSLRTQLQKNLVLLQSLAESPALSKECPPDLYSQLVATVDSSNFLTKLNSLQEASSVTPDNNFVFKEVKGPDLQLVETLVNVDPEEPSWWVWVTDEMVTLSKEERSAIDNENYVIITEEHVIEGVADFIAMCILANPKSKNITPKELHKSVTKAIDGLNNWKKMRKVWHAAKIIYAFSTWGLLLAGLYRHRAVVKVAAKGIGATGKAVMKVL